MNVFSEKSLNVPDEIVIKPEHQFIESAAYGDTSDRLPAMSGVLKL